MPITMTPDGHAIRAGGRMMKLIPMSNGTGVLTDDGPILIFDMIRAFFVISEISEDAHIEEVDGDWTRFTFDACPEMYDILTNWGAEIENDEDDCPAEDDGIGEDDQRDLPRTLSPIGSEPDGSALVPLFRPVPISVLPAAVSALTTERFATRAA